jgi:outer membrane immunogenic protein
MKRHIAAFAMIGALGFTAPADAADMPVKAPVVAAFTWTGFYIGGHAGWGQTALDMHFPSDNFFTLASSFTGCPTTLACELERGNTLSGFLGGGHIGFNYQTGPFVFGVEGAWTWTDFHKRVNSPEFPSLDVWTFDQDWIGSVTGRIGVVGGPGGRLHGYVKGGWAFTRLRTRLDTPSIAGGFADDTSTHNGWTAGAGLEWAFWDNLILGIEYNHYDFGKERHNGAGPFFSATVPCSGSVFGTSAGCFRDVDATTDTVTVRLSYKFGGFILP